MRTDDGLWLAFHEAALTNYPGMTLAIDPEALDDDERTRRPGGRDEGHAERRRVPHAVATCAWSRIAPAT